MLANRRALAVLSPICLLLVSCGGGDGASPPPSSNVPSPTPSPTPLPPPMTSPSPTPAPTPSPTYALATDFSGDRQYTGWGVEAVEDYRGPPQGSPPGTAGTSTFSVTTRPETLAAGFGYTAATQIYIVQWFGFSRSYGPTVDGLNAGRQPFSSTDGFVRFHPWIDNSSSDFTRYLGIIRWSHAEGSNNALFDSVIRNYNSVFGIKTLPSDVPISGTYSFTFFPDLTAVDQPRTSDGADLYQITQFSWSAQIDWPTRAVSGTIRLEPSISAPAGTPPIIISMNGEVGAGRTSVVGRFSGTGISGEFTGNLFGPQGREIGFVYRIMIDGKEAYAGAAGARGR